MAFCWVKGVQAKNAHQMLRKITKMAGGFREEEIPNLDSSERT